MIFEKITITPISKGSGFEIKINKSEKIYTFTEHTGKKTFEIQDVLKSLGRALIKP